MNNSRRIRLLPPLVLGLGACVPGADVGRTTATVEIVEVQGILQPDETVNPSLYRIDLPEGLPPEVAEDLRGQLRALMGREELIAEGHPEYASRACPPALAALSGEGAVLDEIARRAAATSIVIINESHLVSRHRDFISAVAERLRPLGYGIYAAEAFANPDEGRAPAEAPGSAFAGEDFGLYTAEPAFGRLLRRVRSMGYLSVAYEPAPTMADPAKPQHQRIAEREEAQTANLARILEARTGAAKLLVHVGYMHAAEAPAGSSGLEWMAARLKRRTGIDPLTIDQTNCRHEGDAMRLAAPPDSLAAGQYDLLVGHPVTRFTRGRPDWRFAKGDLAVEIPAELRPGDGEVAVEARLVGQPEDTVPVDRVIVRPGEDVVLALPPGSYRLRAVRLAFGE